MIHVKHLYGSDFKKILLAESKDPKTIPETSGLCASFCVAEISEQAAYNKAILNAKDVLKVEDVLKAEDVQASEHPDTVEPCEQRHDACSMCDKDNEVTLVTGQQGERLTFASNLSVLGVCRQLYGESSNVLWGTNTFSFDDPESFTRFVASMNPAQKSKLRKIHLSLNVPIDERNPWCVEKWAKAIPGHILTSLKSVKTVHLTINQYSIWSPRYPPPKLSHTTSQRWVNQTMSQMLRLRMLPWKNKYNANLGKHVTVIISDDASTHLEGLTPRWSRALKLETAESFRALLADLNSPETHKAYTAAAKIEAAERKLREDKEERIDKIQDKIDNLRPRLKSAKEEHKWRIVDREMACDKDKNPLKRYAPISDYQRGTAIEGAKKRFDALDLRMYILKSDLRDVLKDPKYQSLKKTAEDLRHEQDKLEDLISSSSEEEEEGRKDPKNQSRKKTAEDLRHEQDESNDLFSSSSEEEEEGPTSPITANEFVGWLKAPIPYSTK